MMRWEKKIARLELTTWFGAAPPPFARSPDVRRWKK